MSDIVATDVSRVVGRVMVRWKNRDYVLDNFGLDDWSAVQSRLVRDKRARIITAVEDAAATIIESAGDDETAVREAKQRAERLRRDALQETGNVAGLTSDEYITILNQDEGVVLFLWVMFERRYPGQFTRADVKSMLRPDASGQSVLGAESVQEIVSAVQLAMGIDPAGNSTSQSG